MARIRRACETLVLTAVFSGVAVILWEAYLLYSIGSPAGARPPQWKSIRKTNIVGFFAQDLAETDPDKFDWIKSNFGLLDTFNVDGIMGQPLGGGLEARGARRPQWKKFERAIKELNRDAPKNTGYKVLYLARHGQGYHNSAESFYGTHLWDCYWSLLDGNGTVIWADASLTDIGISEAQEANAAWQDEINFGIPLPQAYYVSPLSRAGETLELTWIDTTLGRPQAPEPVVMEKLRETIGIHTCDRRATKFTIAYKFPGFVFEEGFSENDLLWRPEWREPNDARNARLEEALDGIFANDESTYISITAHGGAISSILEVIGHREFRLQTGGMIPVVVRVEFLPDAAPTPTSLSSSIGLAPTCTVDPLEAQTVLGFV